MLIAVTMSALLLLSGAERARPFVVGAFVLAGVLLIVGVALNRLRQR